MFSKKIIEEALSLRLEDCSKKFSSLKKDKKELASIESVNDLDLEVKISSAWAEYGEKTIKFVGKGGLEAVMKRAIAKFKKVNKRSDVQGGYYVGVLLPNGNYFAVDEKYYEQFKEH